jgi:hypothetical protein
MLSLIMLVVIAWLLWMIREELSELNERQHGLKSTLEQLLERSRDQR